MADPLVLVTDDGPVRTLMLNRPAALNSFTGEMHAALRDALDVAAATESVRAIILTGAGRGFCAGQDLNDPALSPGADGRIDVGAVVEANYKPLALRIRAMPVPVVAQVNGVAAGAGANLALGCDIAIAARSASFIQAFAKIALVPDCGGTWLLPRLAGRARALGLALTGDKLMAEQAERWGLIWQCVDDDALPAAARELAHKLAALPTQALAATRRAIDEAAGLDLDGALTMEARLQRERGYSHDFLEGVMAFREKRLPHFTDR